MYFTTSQFSKPGARMRPSWEVYDFRLYLKNNDILMDLSSSDQIHPLILGFYKKIIKKQNFVKYMQSWKLNKNPYFRVLKPQVHFKIRRAMVKRKRKIITISYNLIRTRSTYKHDHQKTTKREDSIIATYLHPKAPQVVLIIGTPVPQSTHISWHGSHHGWFYHAQGSWWDPP